jgi:hypothetical protein
MATFTTPTALLPGNCVLWLDASDSTTLYQLSSNINVDTGVDPVTAINDKIGFWVDKSGKNNNAKIANPVLRPTYSLIDGLSGLYFNGVNNALDITQLSGIYVSDPTNNGYTIFLVVEPDTTGTSDSIQTLFTQTSSSTTYNGYTGGSNNHISVFYTNTPTFITRLNNATVNTQQHKDNCDGYTTSYMSNRFVICSELNSRNNKLYVEGICTNAAASTFTYNSTLSARQIRLGALAQNATPGVTTDYRFKGYIHEVIVYDVAVSLLEQKLVEAYLGKKWQASSYVSYAVKDGDFDDSMTWFNEEVPALSSTVVIPNGFTVSLSGDSFRPRLHNRTLDTISKAGTFKITRNTSLSTDYILQDLRYGRENQNAGLGVGDNVNPASITPVITVGDGCTLELTTPLIQSMWRGAPCVSTGTCTVNVNTLGGIKIYGSLTSPAISAINTNLNIPIQTTIKMGFNNNQPNGFGVTGRDVWAIQATTSTLNIGTSLAQSDLGSGVPPLGNTFTTFNSGKILTTNCNLTITNAAINGYGMEGVNDSNADTSRRCTVVYCYNTGIATTSTFNNCSFITNVSNNNTRQLNVMLNGPGCNGYFNDCVITGYPFLHQGSANGNYRPESVYIIGTANAYFNRCQITGGKYYGDLNTTTTRWSDLNNYGPGIRIGGANNTYFDYCNFYGDVSEGGQAVILNSGNMFCTNSNAFAGAQSNAIYRTGGNLYYSGNQYDSSTGYRAIFASQYYVSPVPKNSLLRYATNGLGTGIDAFTYQYTIDSLSAFSMPPASAVRQGTPYAGGTLIGTSVLPPAEAVSYGTLVDNTTGSAILTLDLLNTFFETPLSALAVPSLSSTIGYRVANSLTSNETIGHLIASFTTN